MTSETKSPAVTTVTAGAFRLAKKIVDKLSAIEHKQQGKAQDNGLGTVVFYRTYSRLQSDGKSRESWVDTVVRVVEGTMETERLHRVKHGQSWDEQEAQQRAQKMATLMMDMKFLPPGRGLWAMGTAITKEKHMFAALNNCGFVSTAKLGWTCQHPTCEELADLSLQDGSGPQFCAQHAPAGESCPSTTPTSIQGKSKEQRDPAEPFCFLMDMSMLGVGIGFDSRGAGQVVLHRPSPAVGKDQKNVFVVPDTREGWVESMQRLLQSYFAPKKVEVDVGFQPGDQRDAKVDQRSGDRRQVQVDFDYSKIRKKGQQLKTFGGTSSGPDALMDLHKGIRKILDRALDENKTAKLTSRLINDIMNMIGCCVAAGNVRRSSEISLGDPDDEDFVQLKNYKRHPERAAFGWASNNSILATPGKTDYSLFVANIAEKGEPGFLWLPNVQKYARMQPDKDTTILEDADPRAMGCNPCSEQSLESYELCCLVETFVAHHTDYDDFANTLTAAYQYAKIVTLCPTHWDKTNQVMTRNRRIGVSITGIAQFVERQGLDTLIQWLDKGYQHLKREDERFSKSLGIPPSIKITTVKPSGTVSLLAGATPGMHYPMSRFYIRRVMIGNEEPLLDILREAGIPVEPSATMPKTTSVAEFPVDMGQGVRSVRDVSMREQFELAALLQRYWSDNQVSVTITFQPNEVPKIAQLLSEFDTRLKSVSLLPYLDPMVLGPDGMPYKQLPYEPITESEYQSRAKKIRPLDLSRLHKAQQAQGPVTCGPIEMPPASEMFCNQDGCFSPSVEPM